MLDEIEIDIKSRSTNKRMFSLLWDLLSSSEFTEMILHPWSSSGYIPGNISLRNIKNNCFRSDSNKCNFDNCDDCFFINYATFIKSLLKSFLLWISRSLR
jgi:hypothetical protein